MICFLFVSELQDYCDGGTLDDKIKTAAACKQYMDEKQVIHVSNSHTCRVRGSVVRCWT
jgi:hypothetical protein